MLPVINGQFTDTFQKCDVHIYRISPGDPFSNLPPVFVPVGNKEAKTGINLSFTVSATDPDEDALVYGTTGLPTGASFAPETRTFTWTPQGYAVADGHRKCG